MYNYNLTTVYLPRLEHKTIHYLPIHNYQPNQPKHYIPSETSPDPFSEEQGERKKKWHERIKKN